MIERLFYERLNEELTKRGFFIVTDYAPQDCIGLSVINGTEKRVRYYENLQENYRLAAVKNIIISVGQEDTAGGFYEILVGSKSEAPFPVICVCLKYNERYYKMAYMCDRFHLICERHEYAVEYLVECLKFETSKLMDVIHEWITEGKFPLHRFAEGSI